ncbi:hypothetical protein D3C80_1887630 [compost metagenome]
MAAPGGLADDVAILAQRCFSQLDHPRQVKILQPEWVAVEHALIVLDQAVVVPVLGF